MSLEKAVIIPGGQKCGSTTLFRSLGHHSLIAPSRIKEPQLLALDRHTVLDQFPWYQDLFGQFTAALPLEASTFYLFSSRAVSHIQEFIAHPKVIILIRDPARRAFSGFLHQHKRIPSRDPRSFDQILRELENSSQQDLYDAEEESLREAIHNDKIDECYLGQDYLKERLGVNFDSYFEDVILPFRYFYQSLYRNRVARFEEAFGRQVYVVVFEELIKRPEYALKKILEFLDVPIEENVLGLPSANKTEVPANTLSRAVLRLRRNGCLRRPMSRLQQVGLVNRLSRRIRNDLYSHPKLSKEQYRRARNLLEDEYRYWCSRFDKLEELWRYE